MWVTKLLISPVKKKDFFAQKQPNLAQNWHFCLLLAHLVPCWWVGWLLLRGLYLARHLFTLFAIFGMANILCVPFTSTSYKCVNSKTWSGALTGENE